MMSSGAFLLYTGSSLVVDVVLLPPSHCCSFVSRVTLITRFHQCPLVARFYISFSITSHALRLTFGGASERIGGSSEKAVTTDARHGKDANTPSAFSYVPTTLP